MFFSPAKIRKKGDPQGSPLLVIVFFLEGIERIEGIEGIEGIDAIDAIDWVRLG